MNRPYLFLILFFLAGAAHAEIGEIDVNAGPPATVDESAPSDRSVLWIKAETRVTVLITDAKGRHTGYDHVADKTLEAIPNSKCEVEFVKNQYTGEPHSEAYERLTFEPAARGMYTVQVYALQDGPFQLDVSALSSNGSSEPSKQIEGIISGGDVKAFHLRYDPAADSQLTVVEK